MLNKWIAEDAPDDPWPLQIFQNEVTLLSDRAELSEEGKDAARERAAVLAAEEGDGPKAARFMWYTFAGGATFLAVKAYEWTTEISHGFTITSNTFWSFYYTAAGLHALHVIAGIIIIAIVARRAVRNIDLHHVELIGVYWHFVDLVWIFLFPLLYIAK